MQFKCTTLKPFQIEDSDFAAEQGRFFLGHKTGLGKTLMAIRAWQLLSERTTINRVLILTSKSGLTAWLKQLPRWTDVECEYLDYKVADKEKKWEAILRGKQPGVWMMSHSLFRDMSKIPKLWPLNGNWDLVIIDEFHRVGRNRKTQIGKALMALALRTRFLFEMSATWLSRGSQDAWLGLHLLNPKYFSSYWKFVSAFCYVEVNEFGGHQILGNRNVPAMQELMKRYYRSRTWEEVEPDLPPVQREVIELSMTPTQRKLYDRLDNDMYLDIERSGIDVVASTSLAKIVRLRQLAISPLLVGSTEQGVYIEDLLERIEEDPHTVIFCFFAELIPHLRRILEGQGYKVFELRGGTEPHRVMREVEAWKKARGVMLCSLLFAESFELDTVRNAYVLGSSYDPQQNIQAEGRLRRLDTADMHAVMVHYYLAEDSVEDAVRDIVNGKAVNTHQILRDVINRRKQPPKQSEHA